MILPICAALLLPGCGAPTPAQGGVQAGAVAGQDVLPDEGMVSIVLTDQGPRSSTIVLHRGTTVMLMVYDQGSRSHQIHAALPVADLSVFHPTSVAQGTLVINPVADGFSVRVTPGVEADVTFAPTVAGRYALMDGSVREATLAVV